MNTSNTKKLATYKDILNERDSFIAIGVITDITGEKDKKSSKEGSKWVGSNANIIMLINGKKQTIKVWGGTCDSTPKIKVFLKDNDGKIKRDGNNKAIQQKINTVSYNENEHLCFDKIEAIEWGDRDASGKATKITHLSELTDGAFANALLDNKSQFIGKRVKISGSTQYKIADKKESTEISASLKQIVFQKVEDGKEYNDRFVFETSIILNTNTLDKIDENRVVNAYVPVYVPYDVPKIVNGVEQKGRNVFTAMNFSVEDNGFLGLKDTLGFSISQRATIMKNRINVLAQNAELVAGRFLLSNKSGMTERTVTFEDICKDPVYDELTKSILDMPDGTEKEEEKQKMLDAYKSINPATVKSEFIQKINFINICQDKDTCRDKIAGLDSSAIEIKSIQQIKEEIENNNGKKNNSTGAENPNIPNINGVNTGKGDIKPPSSAPSNLDDIDDDDAFPF